MKFDQILALYLYQKKRLNLPGIGTFEADSSVYIPEEKEKQKPSMEGISFQNIAVSRADDDLIDFIKEHTGKIKPLAISDLESYLALGKQFLYIGKPFYLEGIGTLKLTKEGRFEFTPGQYVATRLGDPNLERIEARKKALREEERTEPVTANSGGMKRAVTALVILAGIGIAGYGSYYLYNQYTKRQNSPQVNTALLQDSAAAGAAAAQANITDSNQAATGQNTVGTIPGISTYRFVVETTENKLRALNRYYLLKSYGNKIQMTTSDSVRFKLFYTLPAKVEDTLHIRDSLNRWYYGKNSTLRVRIEQ